jgi:NAD-dependent deacetylase
VVWFGEAIDGTVLARCVAATKCDVYLSVGTSSLVQPAAGLVARARAHGAFTVEINPQPTGSACLDLAIALPAEVALPALDL